MLLTLASTKEREECAPKEVGINIPKYACTYTQEEQHCHPNDHRHQICSLGRDWFRDRR
jgi:hypothetical protein